MCFKKKKEAGLAIKTFTGDRTGAHICRIATNQNVKHVVKLFNLLAYRTDVTCVARIITEHRVIRFNPVGVNDSEEKWTATCSMGKFDRHNFSHVGVLSSPPYDEEHEIRVDLVVDRSQRGTVDSASLSITVWS